MATVTPSLSDAAHVVLKIGSALLVDQATGQLNRDWLRALAQDVARVKARGQNVTIVSSGSIALGRGVLGLSQGALPLDQSQAAAAVGQIKLAQAYEEELAPHGITTAQVLLTLEDSENRRRYLNTRATLQQLLSLNVVPIVNENDTVATDEIRYGDNDRLAAQVAVTLGADQLVLLSDVDGLYTANPQVDSTATHLALVEAITPEIEAMSGEGTSGLSKGGMITKVMAAKMATQAGAHMAIASGAELYPLKALEAGARATWFLAETDPQAARKTWIAAMKPKGAVVIDAGAAQALRRGKSLLPAGITQVEGRFGRGDPVQITTHTGAALAVGLTRYTADEARRLQGQHTRDIETLLGYPGRAAVIHRDDMTL
ncbi:MAG: glutamate 5-kinase [Pseudomonadota bacterium]